jgi:hypothetical protein
MKTAKELDKLCMAIGEAIMNYRKAVEANIKESGKELEVVGDDEDEDGIVLKIRDDDAVDTCRIDKVRWNEDRDCAEYHCAEWNYREVDTWTPIYWLGGEQDYVYENINWE